MKFVLCSILATVLVANAGRSSRKPDWDDLKVTFGINVLSSSIFESMPRTLKDASKAGWSLIDSHCDDPSLPFRGFRYWLKSDPAVILILDGKGFIAGIQTAIDLSKVNYVPGPNRGGHPFIPYNNYQVLTAYFVDPSTICTGRSSSDFNNQGTGTGLWLQNGTNPETMSINIPRKEGDIGTTRWTKGKCTWAMGMHYWYDVTSDMPCDKFFPIFLMYDGGNLFGFGWAMNAGLTSKRYEHPTADISGNFIDPVPQCFFTDPSFNKLSTLHIYMTSSPKSVFC
jgi:hypothetical protein